ncbi:hypothetical protein I316_07750 [Kwoniella heveanensis BCC8398]|uniref:Conidiation-specific protein 6 n=1 Tax=Kwoniella heveanensis BCC8398 TaxID=1296120 RepID=A0A1B9GHT1_9TREE|nr:hypothetical protein I316_07750 [Kwoniella heveanensis BCC8398]
MSANTNNVIGGHKAAINNDSVPQESKEHSKQVIAEYEENGAGEIEREDKPKNEGNVIGGHKATLSNPNVGEEAKEHSRQVLQENGIDV